MHVTIGVGVGVDEERDREPRFGRRGHHPVGRGDVAVVGPAGEHVAEVDHQRPRRRLDRLASRRPRGRHLQPGHPVGRQQGDGAVVGVGARRGRRSPGVPEGAGSGAGAGSTAGRACVRRRTSGGGRGRRRGPRRRSAATASAAPGSARWWRGSPARSGQRVEPAQRPMSNISLRPDRGRAERARSRRGRPSPSAVLDLLGQGEEATGRRRTHRAGRRRGRGPVTTKNPVSTGPIARVAWRRDGVGAESPAARVVTGGSASVSMQWDHDGGFSDAAGQAHRAAAVELGRLDDADRHQAVARWSSSWSHRRRAISSTVGSRSHTSGW